MRIKLSLLSTVIALVCGQVYSCEIQNATEETQEISSKVADEVNACRECLKTAISSFKKFSEALQEVSSFEWIDDVLRTKIENTKLALPNSEPLFEIDKMLVEVYEKYKADNSEDFNCKMNELRTKVSQIAQSVELLKDELRAQNKSIQNLEDKLRILDLGLNLSQLYMQFLQIDHTLCTLKSYKDLETFEKKLQRMKARKPLRRAERIKHEHADGTEAQTEGSKATEIKKYKEKRMMRSILERTKKQEEKHKCADSADAQTEDPEALERRKRIVKRVISMSEKARQQEERHKHADSADAQTEDPKALERRKMAVKRMISMSEKAMKQDEK